MDGWTNESPLVSYRTSFPLGLLPYFPSLKFTIMALGIADHILPLAVRESENFEIVQNVYLLFLGSGPEANAVL